MYIGVILTFFLGDQGIKTNCMGQKSYFEMCPTDIVINVSIPNKIINVYIHVLGV